MTESKAKIVYKNGQPWALCPWCGCYFMADQNNNSYADCRECNARIYFDEVYF